MMTRTKQMPLRGIIPPMISPLLGNDELDVDGLRRLTEHLLAGGVHGLFLLGTTGEGPSLSSRVKREVIARVVRHVSRRVPVVVAITDPSFPESIALAEYAADNGADAVVVSVPYYYDISQSDLISYVQQLSSAISLPIVLYNIPQRTSVGFDVDTMRRLLDIESVIGIKDSSGDMVYFHELLQLAASRDDCTVLIGSEDRLLESIAAGGHGGVCGGANVFPRLFVDLYEAVSSGDIRRATTLADEVMQSYRVLYDNGSGSARWINGVKTALAKFGVCQVAVAPPLQPYEEGERQMFLERLERLLRSEASGAHFSLPKEASHCA